MNTRSGQWNERDDAGFGSQYAGHYNIQRLDGGMTTAVPTRKNVTVREIMRRRVATAQSSDTLQKAASLLRDEAVSELPVCDGEVLVGLVTDRDLAIRAMADGANPCTTVLGEIMEDAFFYCFEDQDCAVARRLMVENHVTRLPVTDSRKHLLGMVLLADLK